MQKEGTLHLRGIHNEIFAKTREQERFEGGISMNASPVTKSIKTQIAHQAQGGIV
jgi:hypothetical protein